LDQNPKEGVLLNPLGGREIIKNQYLTTVKLKAGLVSLDRSGFFVFRNDTMRKVRSLELTN
jgi:hypothetical protein